MKTITILITFAFCMGAFAQSPLDNYVKIGLENNLALQQNTMSLKKAAYALKVAKGMFLPSASMQARYSLAQGGRTIDFPIGDLLNPVYSTLNQILEQQGRNMCCTKDIQGSEQRQADRLQT